MFVTNAVERCGLRPFASEATTSRRLTVPRTTCRALRPLKSVIEWPLRHVPPVRYDPSSSDSVWNQNQGMLVKEGVVTVDFLSGCHHEGATMFDFSMPLRANPQLLSLLSHYARIGFEDRTAWQDRLMQMEGVESKELTTLHGELIAFDWIEQNTGHACLLPDGTLSACYRITPNGLREFQRMHGIEAVAEHSETPENSQPRFLRKKKEKHESHVVATSEESKHIQ